MPLWCNVELRLKPSLRGHGWLFAHYLETPSERDDGMWYEAVLFRNRERTKFGIREVRSERCPHTDVQKVAQEIVREARTRAGLLSDDPRLPLLWRRR